MSQPERARGRCGFPDRTPNAGLAKGRPERAFRSVEANATYVSYTS